LHDTHLAFASDVWTLCVVRDHYYATLGHLNPILKELGAGTRRRESAKVSRLWRLWQEGEEGEYAGIGRERCRKGRYLEVSMCDEVGKVRQ
jgi:hypothetical protein